MLVGPGFVEGVECAVAADFLIADVDLYFGGIDVDTTICLQRPGFGPNWGRRLPMPS